MSETKLIDLSRIASSVWKENTNTIDVLSSNLMHGNPWTDQELKYLQRVYASGEPLEEIAAAIPHHSIGSIMTQAKKLGIKRNKGRWSPSEIDYLKSKYCSGESMEAISGYLHRPVKSAFQKVHQLQLRRPPKTIIALNLSPTESAYLAGIVDGEGSITGARNQVRLQITSTDESLVRWVSARIPNCPIYKIESWKYQTNNWKRGINASKKPRYEVQIYRYTDLVPLLEAIVPFLVIKREMAILALEFAKSRINTVNSNYTSVSRKISEKESELLAALRLSKGEKID